MFQDRFILAACMSRYFLEIAYDGTNYNGWQTQPNGLGVQQVLNEKLSIVQQEKIETLGSSRTDTGVHASQTFAHFDCESDLDKLFMRKINFLLPKDISVKKIFEMKSNAHARFDAIERSYEYIFCYEKNPFLTQFSCFYPYKKLNPEVLNEYANLLLHHTDYAAFCKKRTNVKTTLCYIKRAEWKYDETKNTLTFFITANRFLRGMVRGIVATMILGGRGKLSIDGFKNLLNSTEPHKTDFSAPAQGLTLTQVKYPDGYFPKPILVL